jgi:hypothetical protein
MPRSIIRRVAILATLATLATLGVAPAVASANQLSDPVVDRSSSKTARAASPIVCQPVLHNPHKSTHVPGTVNVVGDVTCTAPVAEIKLMVAIYYNGALTNQSPFTSFPHTAFAQNNAAADCQDGTWRGWVYTTVTFYSGYVGSSSGFGPTADITC